MASAQEHWSGESELYALGALDGQELKEYQAHLALNCAPCQTKLRDTREALDFLARSLQPVLPPARVKSRLMDRLMSEKVARISPQSRSRQPRWSIIGGMIAAGLAGMVVAGGYYERRHEARLTVYGSMINLLRDPTTRVYSLYGANPGETLLGRLLWAPSGEKHVFVSNLPPAPAGRMYVVWAMAPAAAPRYVGTLVTDAFGHGVLRTAGASSDRPIQAFAVSLEPEGSASSSPIGPIVMMSQPS